MNNTSLKNKTCAIIPFFNEEKKIKEVVKQCLQYVDLVIAVNDGSSDKSENIISGNDKVRLINLSRNFGKGFALKTGLQKAVEYNYQFAFTLDADMQHPPEYIPYFLDAVKGNDIVIGNRLSLMTNMPFHRKLSNLLTSKILSVKCKQKIKDSQCGYRLFRLSSVKNILPDEAGFEAESEMIVKAAKNKLKISFVDIPSIYAGEVSKMKAFKTIIGFIRILFKKY